MQACIQHAFIQKIALQFVVQLYYMFIVDDLHVTV